MKHWLHRFGGGDAPTGSQYSVPQDSQMHCAIHQGTLKGMNGETLAQLNRKTNCNDVAHVTCTNMSSESQIMCPRI